MGKFIENRRSVIQDFIKRAAESTGFIREKYIEKNIPTNINNIFLLVFLGDLRSQFIASSLLLNRYREENKGKYFILCGFPGCASLYPYADEYWGVKESFHEKAIGFHNDESKIAIYFQQLHRYFADVRDEKELTRWYHNGFTREFFDKQIVYTLPGISSPKPSFIKQFTDDKKKKVFISPLKFIKRVNRGKEENVRCEFDFWANLIAHLIEHEYRPVIWHGPLCHDVSTRFGHECVYCTDTDIMDVLSAIRFTGCLIDVFGDTDKLAMIARCPYVSCVDRTRYNFIKDYEIDDLCAYELSHKYIFSTATMIETGQWKELADNIMSKLKDLTLECPSAPEISTVVPYERVKARRQKKTGLKFIRVPRGEIR